MSDVQTILGKVGASTVTAFRFVKTNALVIDPAIAAGAATLGIAVETATTGKTVTVNISGLCEVDCAAAFVPGETVTSDGNGKAVGVAAGEHILGVYMPVPVNGVISNSVSGTRIRINLFADKKTLGLA